MGFFLKNNDNVWLGYFKHLYDNGIKHAISARNNGVSQPPYRSLNMALHVGDVDNNVLKNRKIFCDSLNINYNNLVTAQQTHSDNIYIVTKKDIGKGSNNFKDVIKNTDALITNENDIPLMLFFADCVPILVADKNKATIGVIHAGWKGTVNKIAQKTILKMINNFGILKEDILVGIGPSIGQCCFEVDFNVINPLKNNFPNTWNKFIKINDNKQYVNLWDVNIEQLTEIGIRYKNILSANICTKCNNDIYFSYREENGITGRIGAIISL